MNLYSPWMKLNLPSSDLFPVVLSCSSSLSLSICHRLLPSPSPAPPTLLASTFRSLRRLFAPPLPPLPPPRWHLYPIMQTTPPLFIIHDHPIVMPPRNSIMTFNSGGPAIHNLHPYPPCCLLPTKCLPFETHCSPFHPPPPYSTRLTKGVG